MELLIKKVRIVDWSMDTFGDVYIKNGLIEEIGKDLNKNCDVLNGEGKVLMPAFIDLHVHFREPGFNYKEDIETGSKAAVKGGYTMVNLMANTMPVCSSMEEVNYVENRAKEVGLIDVHQVVSITKDFDGKDTSHLDALEDKVKVISEDGKDVMDSKVLIDAMVKAREKDLLVMCHCENHELSKLDMRLAENTMTWRNLKLASFTESKIHISHVSTKEAMEYIIDEKKKGGRVTCEVAPHHLALTEEESNYRVNPPIRKREDINFLIKSIKEGFVDAIATDHAPHTEEDKKKGAPGISGIETAFSVSYSELVKKGYITLSKLSELMSKKPGEILKVNKGQIKLGFEGDLVLVDLEEEYKINKEEFLSKGKNTPLHGKNVFGKVVKTIKAGKVVYSE